ncbi:periplasmic heavy metal sensor [Bythopirellula goksoeyrii]|uniref:Periplasmic heavy metal sensor n=1 Tax=Bythopirellula goksoeyrii TaxID=1400387 RepID=A0A5B9Q9R1_9BACT|nr:periplasmic heavy metal sensor [Bythopirellula goksoeyrii]QEG35794.1 hypothetical protein Pr1d_31000 [Bythopirellula goksoeyrii]
METFAKNIGISRTIVYLVLSLPIVGNMETTSNAKQSEEDHPSHQSHSANESSSPEDDASLLEQFQKLQGKIAALEAALKQNHQATSPPAQGGMSMGNMQNNSEPNMAMMQKGQMATMSDRQSMQSGQGMGMGNMGKGMSGMDAGGMGMMSGMGSMQSGQGMGGMGMGGMGMMGGEGMAMMGRMPGMGQMQMPSALPGFPGASHIYHVGSSNFFLDHMQHIEPSQDQQTKLNQIKQQTLMSQATYDRSIAEAEQDLWGLTSAEFPSAAEIEAKIREIEKLQSDKRIAFIRAVGEAAQVLSDEQRQALVGVLPLEHTTTGNTNQH